MSDFLIRLRDANRHPLNDTVDLSVSSPSSGSAVRRKRNHQGTRPVKMTGLGPGETYTVSAWPMRHRPVQKFVRARAEGIETIELYCPVDPQRVTAIVAPQYAALPEKAQAILQASNLDHPPRNVSGQALYDSAELAVVPKAGLLNLLAKMGRTPLTNGSTVLDHVDSLYRLRGDRLFANVATALRDLVKTAVGALLFREVSGSLHAPPPNYYPAGSYKSYEPYGNLQITFISNPATLELKADIDIDDAAGIQHIFQVIGHTLVDGHTSPFDIHEILAYYQYLDPGYTLVI